MQELTKWRNRMKNEPQIKKDGKDDERQRSWHKEVQAATIPRGVGRLMEVLTGGGGRSRLTTWKASGEGGRGPDCGAKGG